MSGTLIVQNLQGPASGANANKIIVPAGQVLDASAGTFTPSAGQIIQCQTYIDQTNGIRISVAQGANVWSTLYTMTFTPKITGSLTVINANVFLGYTERSSSTDADSDNKGLAFYRGATQIAGKSDNTAYIKQGFYGTDVPGVVGTSPYYGFYDGDFKSVIQPDPTPNTAGVTVTYYLKGWLQPGPAGGNLNYNRTYSRPDGGGPSSYQIMEIAQ